MIVMTASPQVTLQTVNQTQSRPPPSPCILIPTSDYLQYLTEPPPPPNSYLHATDPDP